jgi:PadR family transcriptional regulator PadR
MKVTQSLVAVAVAILTMDNDSDARIWGYALSKLSGVRSGVLYPQLDRMLSDDWLEDHWETQEEITGKRPARRYYVVTEYGRGQLGAAIKRPGQERRVSSVQVRPA